MELGEGFPDITLLTSLAFYFDVTIDELLGVDKDKVLEKINEYSEVSSPYLKNGEPEKYLEVWERAYAEFPNNTLVMTNLMFALSFNGNPKRYLRRAIAFGEEILKKSTDPSDRESAVQQLCYNYDELGEKEMALYYADMGGSEVVTQKSLRAFVLYGGEGACACQDYIERLIDSAVLHVMRFAAKINYEPKETIAA